MEEVPLGGGWVNVGAVVRVGDTVRRPRCANSPFVHEFLIGLERVGFDGAPRFLGIDDRGREILSLLPGEPMPNEHDPTADELRSAAELLRRFHAAAPGVVHGDPGQWNMLWVEGRATALVDFDGARRGAPLEDVGYLAWKALRLGPAGQSAVQQRPRLAILADAYGIAVDDALVAAIDGAMRSMRAKGEREDWQQDVLAAIDGERAWLREKRDYLL